MHILHVCPNHKFSTQNIPVIIKFNRFVFDLKGEVEEKRYLPPSWRNKWEIYSVGINLERGELQTVKKSITWFLDKWIPRYYGVISFLQNLFRMLRNSPERDNQFLTQKKVNSQNNQRDSTVYDIGWKDAMKIKWKMDILSMHLAKLIEQSQQEV